MRRNVVRASAIGLQLLLVAAAYQLVPRAEMLSPHSPPVWNPALFNDPVFLGLVFVGLIDMAIGLALPKLKFAGQLPPDAVFFVRCVLFETLGFVGVGLAITKGEAGLCVPFCVLSAALLTKA